MELHELVDALDAEGHQRLQEIVALGRWPDGRKLSETELQTCLQALIGYEAQLPKTDRTGYIAQHCKNGSETTSEAQKVKLTHTYE